METMLEAIDRLNDRGYRLDLSAAKGAKLRTLARDAVFDAQDVVVNETVRFEGDSNPDDSAILVAVTTADGRRGLFSSAYGPAATPDEASVLRALVAG